MLKISTKKKYETNPFTINLKGKMYLQPRANVVIAKGQSIIDTHTGEVVNENILIGSKKIVDKSEFAKIYASEIADLFRLSKTAMNVFLYLCKVMDYDNKAHFQWAKLYKNYSTAYKGIKELIKVNIIAPSIIQNVYWLNPTIICKGERFAKYTEIVTKEYAERQLAEQQKQKLELGGGHKLDAMTNTEVQPHQKTIHQTNIFGGMDEVNPYTGDVIKKTNNNNNNNK